RILAGGEPASAAPDSAVTHYDDPALQHIAQVPGLPPEVVRGLIALARNWREQEDEEETRRRRA
ncbi:MAG TPA: hypothetical protein VGG25_15345, partial [Streptosporangiaceae bacterium]